MHKCNCCTNAIAALSVHQMGKQAGEQIPFGRFLEFAFCAESDLSPASSGKRRESPPPNGLALSKAKATLWSKIQNYEELWGIPHDSMIPS